MPVVGDSPFGVGAASHTALRVAALRALHQTIDVPPVFVDPLAERILGPDADELLEPYRATADDTAPLRATLAARGVFVSEAIARAIARGVRQTIVLGAGLDTFAYRQTIADVRVFEVDRPAAQAWKRNLLHRARIAPPATMAYVGANLERDDVLASLAAAGFDASRPAVFVMLGVSFYLARATLLDLLRRIGTKCAGGTVILFDYSEPLDRAPEEARARYRKAAERVAAAGEPWIGFFAPSEIDEALRAHGFGTRLDLDAAAQNTRWFAHRTDGLAVVPLAHLVQATTGGGLDIAPLRYAGEDPPP